MYAISHNNHPRIDATSTRASSSISAALPTSPGMRPQLHDELGRASCRSAEREAFIAAMRGAVTGVNVVTTNGPAGRMGLTVSAFASVSADPPTVLVCINRASPVAAAVQQNRRFCVNVLSTEQRDLADAFAGRPRVGRPYDFAVAQWTAGIADVPKLTGALAQFECVLSRAVDAGSHVVCFGTVSAATSGDGSALLYRDRRYGRACTN